MAIGPEHTLQLNACGMHKCGVVCSRQVVCIPETTWLYEYFGVGLLPALGLHRARCVVRRAPRLQHLGGARSIMARQVIVHLPRPDEVEPVDRLRTDRTAPPAEQSDVCGPTLESGAHALEGEGTHPEDHDVLVAPVHVLAVARQPAPHRAQEVNLAPQRQTAWHAEPSVGAHHHRAAAHLEGHRLCAAHADDVPAWRR